MQAHTHTRTHARTHARTDSCFLRKKLSMVRQTELSAVYARSCEPQRVRNVRTSSDLIWGRPNIPPPSRSMLLPITYCVSGRAGSVLDSLRAAC